jgi:hypothetical protein
MEEKMKKELASALQNIETMKRELKTYISRQQISDFENAQMRKELACALESIEALKWELTEKNSDTEKSAISKKRESALEYVKVLEHDLRKSTLNIGTAMKLIKERARMLQNIGALDRDLMQEASDIEELVMRKELEIVLESIEAVERELTQENF